MIFFFLQGDEDDLVRVVKGLLEKEDMQAKEKEDSSFKNEIEDSSFKQKNEIAYSSLKQTRKLMVLVKAKETEDSSLKKTCSGAGRPHPPRVENACRDC